MRRSDIHEDERSLNLLLVTVLALSIIIIPILERIRFASGFVVFLVAAITVLAYVERLNRRAAQAAVDDLEVSIPAQTDQDVRS